MKIEYTISFDVRVVEDYATVARIDQEGRFTLAGWSPSQNWQSVDNEILDAVQREASNALQRLHQVLATLESRKELSRAAT